MDAIQKQVNADVNLAFMEKDVTLVILDFVLLLWNFLSTALFQNVCLDFGVKVVRINVIVMETHVIHYTEFATVHRVELVPNVNKVMNVTKLFTISQCHLFRLSDKYVRSWMQAVCMWIISDMPCCHRWMSMSIRLERWCLSISTNCKWTRYICLLLYLCIVVFVYNILRLLVLF